MSAFIGRKESQTGQVPTFDFSICTSLFLVVDDRMVYLCLTENLPIITPKNKFATKVLSFIFANLVVSLLSVGTIKGFQFWFDIICQGNESVGSTFFCQIYTEVDVTRCTLSNFVLQKVASSNVVSQSVIFISCSAS